MCIQLPSEVFEVFTDMKQIRTELVFTNEFRKCKGEDISNILNLLIASETEALKRKGAKPAKKSAVPE